MTSFQIGRAFRSKASLHFGVVSLALVAAAASSACGSSGNGSKGPGQGGAGAGASGSGAGSGADGNGNGNGENPYEFDGINYGEALQKTLYFWEAQESGELSPGNRVKWRGPANMSDGDDVGLDLTGGWFDAGDHWKMNETMAYGASFLAWSAIEYAEAYEGTKQTEHVLNSLRYINDYFSRSIQDSKPGSADDFSGHELYLDIAGKTTPEEPKPSVHQNWCGPEVLDGVPVREALKATSDVPASDVAGGMAGAMAASAIVLFEQGTSDDKALADKLLKQARKLALFGDEYRSEGSQASIRPNGKIVDLKTRETVVRDDLIWAYIWLHRAEKALGTSGYEDAHLEAARAIVDEMDADMSCSNYQSCWGKLKSWWYEEGYGHHLLMSWLQTDHTAEEEQEFSEALRGLLGTWREAPATDDPNGSFFTSEQGLIVRENYGGFFSAQRVMRVMSIGLMLADWTDDEQESQELYDHVIGQTNYFLGDNAQEQSYLVGFGTAGWPNFYHHAAAHGAYRGFSNLDRKSEYHLDRMKHVLYGGLLPGPDGKDQFDDAEYRQTEVTLTSNGRFQVVIAGIVARDPEIYPLDPNFPPPEERNDSLDINDTDREFFVAVNVVSESSGQLVLDTQLHNHTAWPPRISDGMSYRYFFRKDGGDVSAEVSSSEGGQLAEVAQFSGDVWYAEVEFPGERLLPNYVNSRDPRTQYMRRAKLTLSAATLDSANDPSAPQNGEAPDGDGWQLVPQIAVYQDGELVGGQEP